MEKIMEVMNLSKQYGHFTAVKDISFHVNKGEIFGFLGPNGAGKTTTINMLTGMAKISDGRIYYKGIDLTKKIKKAQEIIGVVADESNLYDEMTGYENLCFCGSLYGLSKVVRRKRSYELLETFGLMEAAGKRFKAYSKGMKRKLTIAAAFIHEPEILFLDEPTTGIDVASARHIRNLLKKRNESGTTVFLTTHYIEEAERLCDRVAFINKGSIKRIDTVARLLEDTKEANVIEVVFEPGRSGKSELLKRLQKEFPDVGCSLKNEDTIKVVSTGKIDITPIVRCLSDEGAYILEARLLKPTLEDTFVKMTGIEIDTMKKEKEKK
ncbi:MAG: ABC transporter ATP-binding protein [Spirochaetales bacterium]|nr:ABC transporter ATP-binding protein [Spirochaetales bacterium]